MIWALKLAGIYAFRRILFQGVVQEVQATAQRCHRLAMSSLLDLICDAVVDLDAGLVMTGHFPKFANMLMHGSGRSLESARGGVIGRSSGSSMCSTSRVLLLSSLTRPSVTGVVAPVLPLATATIARHDAPTVPP